jgi:DNA-binding FadR family transcriptional regulator
MKGCTMAQQGFGRQGAHDPSAWPPHIASQAGGRRSAVEVVRDRIAANIQSGRIKVDEQLPSEAELARLFGVSRPVVREAIVSLNALGLTASRNGRGTFVARTSVKADLLLGGFLPSHVNEVRRCLEIPAARLAAARRTRQDIVRMEELLAGIDAEDAADRRNRIDAEFHIAIATATCNPLLTKLIGDLRGSLEDESLTVSVVRHRRAGARAEHRAILDAIAAGDADAADLAVKLHLDAIDASLASLVFVAAPDRK